MMQTGNDKPDGGEPPEPPYRPMTRRDAKHARLPPIRAIWSVVGGIATLILLLLTAWKLFVPAGPSPIPSATSTQTAANEKPGHDSPPPRTGEAQAATTGSNEANTGSGKPTPEKPTTSPSASHELAVVTQPVVEGKTALPPIAKEKEAEEARAAAGRPSPIGLDEKHEAVQPNDEDADAKKQEAEDKAEEDRRWLAAAKEFAGRHQGHVLEGRPFVGGTLRWSPVVDGPLDDQAVLFLGGGRLETDFGVYSFGGAYQYAPPLMRQEIPHLADKLGLGSARIEIHRRDNEVVIEAAATSKVIGPEVVADARNQVVRLENRLYRLNYLVNEWVRLEKSGDDAETNDKKSRIRTDLLSVLEVQTSSQSERSVGDEPDKSEESAAAARQDREHAVGAHDRIANDAEKLARQEISRLERRIRQLQSESKNVSAELQDEKNRAVDLFKNGCRKLTIVVYQSVAAQSLPAKEPATEPPVETAVATPSPITPPSQVAEPQSVAPDDLKETPGVVQLSVDYRDETAEGAFSPTRTEMAKLTVQVVPGPNSGLPRWFHDEFIANCTVWQYPADGTARSRDLTGVDKPKTLTITTGTSQVAVRFWLSRKKAHAGEGDRPVAETPWHVLKTVQDGAEYRLKAPLTQEMLASLQPKPSKQPKTPKSSSSKKPR